MALQYWKAITLWSLLKGVNNLQIKESHCADAGALPRSHFVTEHTEKLILKINLKPTDRIHHHVGQITTHHRFPLVGFSRRVGSIRCPYHRGYVDRKSTRLNSSHVAISYAVFCLKKKNKKSNAPTGE